jgi:hypothetical protein
MFGRRKGVDLIETAEMEGFFEQLDHMNLEQLLSLRATWRATSPETHQEAWAAVRAVGVRDDLTKEIDRVRKKALAWASRGSNLVPYTFNDNLVWQEAKLEAGEAIVDAALAVALGSRLDAAQHEVLIAPWLRATEV